MDLTKNPCSIQRKVIRPDETEKDLHSKDGVGRRHHDVVMPFWLIQIAVFDGKPTLTIITPSWQNMVVEALCCLDLLWNTVKVHGETNGTS